MSDLFPSGFGWFVFAVIFFWGSVIAAIFLGVGYLIWGYHW